MSMLALRKTLSFGLFAFDKLVFDIPHLYSSEEFFIITKLHSLSLCHMATQTELSTFPH